MEKTITSTIIITRHGANRTLSSRLVRSQSMRDGGHACYRWSAAVDDGAPAAGRSGWAIVPAREYATVWQALRAATVAGWTIQID